ncbi:uncharacterized protein DUF4365 [Agromyces ramosus]|uniref:Uncharacterized protein DUF4365 n=1 Tax=Agromyces ramosus TaxID=33879 RepID=A0A4Q7MK75_9MICO|nr:DUF4365 domain-containing protein [Agromyces ramosus]RZS68277.1 uncharacterized protein DUF4365 [Agromyces ramosus]
MSEAPGIGDNDQLESVYMQRLIAILTEHGIPLAYMKDRAGIDTGLHLFAADDSTGALRVSQVRVWFQAKGKHADTLPLAEYEQLASVPVSERLGYVRYWYAHPEPVYLVVYVEAAEEFIAEDVRDIVDRQWPEGRFYTETEGQQSVTLRVQRSAVLDADRIKGMLAHRSMRIDGPAFRGRPLGHRFDPIRSAIRPGSPNLIGRLVVALLEAHDFHPYGQCEEIAPELAFVRGRLYETLSWQSPMFTEYGFGADDDFRIEPPVEALHGEVAIVIDLLPDRSEMSENDRASLLSLIGSAREEGAAVAVITNASETGRHSGMWRALLREGAHESDPSGGPLLGLESLTSLMLVATHVYLDFSTEVEWSHVNYLY